MTFRETIEIHLRKSITITGRASRSEYRWFFVFGLVGSLFFSKLAGLINGLTLTPDGPTVFSIAFSLAVFIPGIAVGVRHLNDTGNPDHYLLYPAVALVIMGLINTQLESTTIAPDGSFSFWGGIFAAITLIGLCVAFLYPLLLSWWLTHPSQPGPNTYGPNPTEVTP